MINKTTGLVFRLGLRQKVLLVLIVVLLSALTVSGWFALQNEKENILKEVNQRGSDISRFVAKSLVYSVVGYDYHTIDLLLKEITLSEDIGYSKVINLKGNTMAEAGHLIENNPSKMVIFNQDLVINTERVGSLILGFSTTKTMKRLEKQKYTLIQREAFIILFIALAEFLALSFIVIKPVSIISNSLQNGEDGIVLGTIPLNTNDEFGELAKQFNQLSHNLNIANAELKSRAEYADEQLIKTNNLLLERSAELMDLNTEFKKLSITDSLTGLYNRRHFEETLNSEMEITKRHGDTNSLLIFDIDNFKLVNDKFGHAHGDSVIKIVAENIKSRLRETDILCRIGGEEFVAICKRAGKTEALKISEDIRNSIEQREINIGDDVMTITISIGVSTVVNNMNKNVDNIFKNADLALYESKSAGRNRVTHYDDMKVS